MPEAKQAHAGADSDLVGVEQWDRDWRSLRSTRMPPTFRYLYRLLFEAFRAHVVGQGRRVLEVGCGGGVWMALLSKRLGFQVYGLDYSSEGCQLARNRLVQEGLPALVVSGDIFAPPWRIRSFDVVYALGVVEHFRDARAAMDAMASLVKPGGQLVVGVPNMNGLMGYLHRLADLDLWLRHVPLTLEDVERLFGMLGWDIQYAGYLGTLCLAGPNWPRRLKSGRLASLVRIGLAALETALTFPLRIFRLQLESSHWSPYLLVVGLRPLQSH